MDVEAEKPKERQKPSRFGVSARLAALSVKDEGSAAVDSTIAGTTACGSSSTGCAPRKELTDFWAAVVTWTAITVAGLHDVRDESACDLNELGALPPLTLTIPKQGVSKEYTGTEWREMSQAEYPLNAPQPVIPLKWHKYSGFSLGI